MPNSQNFMLPDATLAAKASVGSVLVTWGSYLASMEVVVYLSFFFGVVTSIVSIVKNIFDNRRAKNKALMDAELHRAKMEALRSGRSLSAIETQMGEWK